jgi:hypothetical protein
VIAGPCQPLASRLEPRLSNHTPASIRARDKERKAQEKHPKPAVAERKSRWLSGAKLTWSLVGGVVTIITAILTFLPHLTISQNGTVRSHDAMGTIFNLTNDALPIYDVEQICGVDITADNGRPIVSGVGLGMKNLGNLGMWETKSLDCQHSASRFNAQTSLTIVIKYRPLLWFGKLSMEFPLQAEKADDGTWVWKSL